MLKILHLVRVKFSRLSYQLIPSLLLIIGRRVRHDGSVANRHRHTRLPLVLDSGSIPIARCRNTPFIIIGITRAACSLREKNVALLLSR